jgi:hypothetical protein
MKKLLLFICICVFTQYRVSAQIGVYRLHRFMQANADSTIIYESKGSQGLEHNYLIMSKKGDTLTCYTYRDLAYVPTSETVMPRSIRRAMFEHVQVNIWSVVPDVNEFFRPYPMRAADRKKFWSDLNAFKPWAIKDDGVDGLGCPVVKRVVDGQTIVDNNVVDDGGYLKLYLITKDKIKVLEFFEPYWFEKKCPGREGRIAALKLAALFTNTIR